MHRSRIFLTMSHSFAFIWLTVVCDPLVKSCMSLLIRISLHEINTCHKTRMIIFIFFHVLSPNILWYKVDYKIWMGGEHAIYSWTWKTKHFINCVSCDKPVEENAMSIWCILMDLINLYLFYYNLYLGIICIFLGWQIKFIHGLTMSIFELSSTHKYAGMGRLHFNKF